MWKFIRSKKAEATYGAIVVAGCTVMVLRNLYRRIKKKKKT